MQHTIGTGGNALRITAHDSKTIRVTYRIIDVTFNGVSAIRETLEFVAYMASVNGYTYDANKLNNALGG